MSAPRLRTLLVLGLIVGVLAKMVRALRGEPAPAFSNHPTVDGGLRPVTGGGSPVTPLNGATTAPSLAPEPAGVTTVAEPAEPVGSVEPATLPEAAATTTAPPAAQPKPPAERAPVGSPAEAVAGQAAPATAGGGQVGQEAPVESGSVLDQVAAALGDDARPAGVVSRAGSEGVSWVPPVDGACPPDHPVKVKLKSGIIHLPGQQAYDRTRPDRCYTTVEAALADGFRTAKR